MIQKEKLEDNVFVLDKEKNLVRSALHNKDFDYVYCSNEDRDDLDPDGFSVLTHDKKETDSRAAARKMRSGLNEKYYVKFSQSGDFFDPTDKTHIYQANRRVNGLPYYSMREVPKEVFENYIMYLKTNNRKFLSQARTSN